MKPSHTVVDNPGVDPKEPKPVADYPKYLYHHEHGSKLVNNEEEEDQLYEDHGYDWHDNPGKAKAYGEKLGKKPVKSTPCPHCGKRPDESPEESQVKSEEKKGEEASSSAKEASPVAQSNAIAKPKNGR